MIETLKQAARNYLHSIEGDGPLEEVTQAKERLAETAILWAQAEAIAEVENKNRSSLPDLKKE